MACHRYKAAMKAIENPYSTRPRIYSTSEFLEQAMPSLRYTTISLKQIPKPSIYPLIVCHRYKAAMKAIKIGGAG